MENTFHNIIIDKYYEKYTYNQFTDIICDPKYINELSEIFNDDSKLLFVACLINGYPRDILDDILEPVYFSAKNVVESYILNHENVLCIIEKLGIFKHIFNEYKERDKKKIIHYLLVETQDLINTLEITTDEQLKKLLNTRLNTLKKRLQQFNALHYINSKYNYDIITGFEYIGDNITFIIKKAYWDVLYKNINPNINIILDSINHIIKTYNDIIPNNIKLNEDFKKHIDTEYIHQLITHGLFDVNELNKFVCVIFNKIKYIICGITYN